MQRYGGKEGKKENWYCMKYQMKLPPKSFTDFRELIS